MWEWHRLWRPPAALPDWEAEAAASEPDASAKPVWMATEESLEIEATVATVPLEPAPVAVADEAEELEWSWSTCRAAKSEWRPIGNNREAEPNLRLRSIAV